MRAHSFLVMFVDFIDTLLSIGTMVAIGMLVVSSIVLVVPFLRKYLASIMNDVRTNSIKIAFTFALLAMLGSLFYSEIAGYTPCLLCWYQRIAMYPLVFFLGGAIYKGVRDVRAFVLPLSLTGAAIAAYHYFTQITSYTGSCAADAVDCAQNYIFFAGFITIPLMAFTAFCIISLLVLVAKKEE